MCRYQHNPLSTTRRRFLDILGTEKKKAHAAQREILPTKWWFNVTTSTLESQRVHGDNYNL
jgi:hypothetical protein